MNEETALGGRIRAALNVIPGVRVWRNNVGFASWEKVRYGLAVGSGDYIGLVDGRFFSVEVKTAKGRTSSDQKLWRETILRLGGYACVVRSPEEAIAAVEACRADARRP